MYDTLLIYHLKKEKDMDKRRDTHTFVPKIRSRLQSLTVIICFPLVVNWRIAHFISIREMFFSFSCFVFCYMCSN